jgi:hypothetical protein
MLLSVR